MQKFGQTLITDAGKAMLTAVDGAQGRIIYTKAILSSQDVSTLGDDKVRALTALSDDKLDTAINVITVQTDTVTVGASFNNATVTQDILFNSIGWYAKTTVDNVEHLLAVTPSLAEQTLIASTNGASSASVDIELAMARGHNTTVTVSPVAVGLIDNTQLQSAVNTAHDDLATQIATQIATKANSSDVYTKAEIDPKLADAGKLKTINGKAPDSSGDVQVPAYAPNLLLGTSHTPITKSLTDWGDGFQYHISENIPKGTKISIRAYINNQTNLPMDFNGIFGYLLSDHLVSHVTVPPHSTGYSYDTFILDQDIGTNGYMYSSFTNQISDSESATISDVKLAVWSDPNTPPDMTWVPNEADKANSSDLATLQGTVTSQGNTISQNTTAILTKANSSDVYTKSEIDPMIAPVNWKTVDSVNVDTITYTSKLFITNVIGAPTSGGTWGYLVTDRGHDNPNNRVTQEWWSDGGNSGQTTQHYYRQMTYDNQSWSPWLAQATQNDLTTLQGMVTSQGTAITQAQKDITALQNAQPIMASSQDDAVAKSKNSNNEYYW